MLEQFNSIQFKFKHNKINQQHVHSTILNLTTAKTHGALQNSTATIKENQITGKSHQTVQIQTTIYLIRSSILFREIEMLKQFKSEHIKN